MVWTDEDCADVQTAIAKVRALTERLEADARNRRPGGRTREAIAGALDALLALDDVYFGRADGSRDADVWRRARLTVRPGA